MKFKIYHYQQANLYYPMVKTIWGWCFINWCTNNSGDPTKHWFERVKRRKNAVCQFGMENAESIIKKYHEHVTKQTVVSFDVVINEVLLKRRKKQTK